MTFCLEKCFLKKAETAGVLLCPAKSYLLPSHKTNSSSKFQFLMGFVCLLCFVVSRKVHGYSQNLARCCGDWAGDKRRHQPFSYSWGMRTHPFWLICPLPSSWETQNCTKTLIWWIKLETASQLKYSMWKRLCLESSWESGVEGSPVRW